MSNEYLCFEVNKMIGQSERFAETMHKALDALNNPLRVYFADEVPFRMTYDLDYSDVNVEVDEIEEAVKKQCIDELVRRSYEVIDTDKIIGIIIEVLKQNGIDAKRMA